MPALLSDILKRFRYLHFQDTAVFRVRQALFCSVSFANRHNIHAFATISLDSRKVRFPFPDIFILAVRNFRAFLLLEPFSVFLSGLTQVMSTYFR
jgi:hypothetical protein